MNMPAVNKRFPIRLWVGVATITVFVVIIVVTAWPEPKVKPIGKPYTVDELKTLFASNDFVTDRSKQEISSGTLKYKLSSGVEVKVRLYNSEMFATDASDKHQERFIYRNCKEHLQGQDDPEEFDEEEIYNEDMMELSKEEYKKLCSTSAMRQKYCPKNMCRRQVACNSNVSTGWTRIRQSEKLHRDARDQAIKELEKHCRKHSAITLQHLLEMSDSNSLDFVTDFPGAEGPPTVTFHTRHFLAKHVTYESRVTVYSKIKWAIIDSHQDDDYPGEFSNAPSWFLTAGERKQNRLEASEGGRACNVVFSTSMYDFPDLSDDWNSQKEPPEMKSMFTKHFSLNRLGRQRQRKARKELRLMLKVLQKECGHKEH